MHLLFSRMARAALAAAVLGAATEPATAARPRSLDTQTGPLRVETVADGLNHPWGMVFLPDGRMLVTERAGRLRVIGPRGGKPYDMIQGLPKIWADGQGGLLDVSLHPSYATNRLVYVCYAEEREGGESTAVARGRLVGSALDGVEVIFRQRPKVDGPNHFGCRLAFAPDGRLFVTLGERFKFEPAQDLGSDLGKIVRIGDDGTVPHDNPFFGRPGARPEIWSYGHRNVQGAAIHPVTGALWVSELGPRGGDEIDIARTGGNYGWPLVSWGENYDGKTIPTPPTRPDLLGAVYHWTPSISPSGIAFYTRDRIPGWYGNLLVAALSGEALVRLTLDGDRVAAEERIAMGERIRDVVQGPDGAVYLLVDDDAGAILRLTPPVEPSAVPPSPTPGNG